MNTSPSALMVSRQTSVSEEPQCVICQEDFNDHKVETVAFESKCGHYYHLSCASMWFVQKKTEDRDCALCRGKPMPMVNTKTEKKFCNQVFPDSTFFEACSKGCTDMLQKFMSDKWYSEGLEPYQEKKVLINIFSEHGETGLMLAAVDGHLDTVKLLIREGADVNLCDSDGVSPLMFACENEEGVDTIKLLIENGADVNALQNDGCTALMIACSNQSSDNAQLLINKGAIVNVDLADGYTPLMIACHNELLDTVKLLIINGADINACRSDGYTILMVACEQVGNSQVIDHLIDSNADINTCTADGLTALGVAIKKRKIWMVEMLIKKGADVNKGSEGNSTCLMLALKEKNEALISLIIESGAIPCKGVDNLPALNWAVINEKKDLLGHLITNGADLKEDNDNLLMTLAVERGNHEIVSLLMSAGVDMKVSEKKRSCALSLAMEKEKYNVFEVFMDSGVDVNSKIDGVTLLMKAAMCNSTSFVDILRVRGANINF